MSDKKDGAESGVPKPGVPKPGEASGETQKVDTGAQEDAAKERGRSGGMIRGVWAVLGALWLGAFWAGAGVVSSAWVTGSSPVTLLRAARPAWGTGRERWALRG